MRGTVGTALGLGVVTGLRSLSGAAFLARELSGRGGIDRWRTRRRSRVERWLTEPAVARTLQVLAVGELIADKAPGMTDRTEPGALLGRVFVGAVLGGIAVEEDRRTAGVVAGALGAVAGAFAGKWFRREAARATFLPDPALAIAEDAVALAAARELAADV